MANKKKAEQVNLDNEVQFGEPAEETLIETPKGAIAVAIRYAETADSARVLITIRAGYGAKDIEFNFGNDGPQVRGGGPGDPPPCP